MPSWKKVIISGSNAALNTLTVSNGVTGSLFGTASWAVSSSNSQNAQDLLLYVKNVSGAQIDKGKVVRISGATGDNALIATASYENDGLSANTLGIVNQNIPNDSFGYVITEGTFIGFDTSTPGWTAGQLLYLGANGTITGSAPQAPLHAVRLGQVLRVQAINGSMYVRIDNGYELGELHDVRDTTTTSSFGDLLVKSGSVWTNSRQLTGSYGLTGSLNATSFTGSFSGSHFGPLTGTASYASQALSASYSITSSNALTASFVTSSNVFGPNGLNSILSASFAISSSRAVSSSNALTASFVLSSSYAVSSSNALTASFVNTLTQNVLITGSLTVGSSSLGASENTITLGARDGASEGGQIGFNAPGGTYTSASFIDNWQNKARILKGNNTTSTGLLAQWDIHTTQLQLPGYTAASSFPGTATANLAVDSGGNVITVSTSGGSVFPYTGNAVITGSLTTTGIIYAQPNGGMYFQGGDDAALYDINVANTMGIYGMQDSTVGAIKLGSSGPVLYGSGSSLGIGTTNPSSASLTVSGNVWATSFTGSLFGTSSWAVSASWAPVQVSASYATTASFVTSSNVFGPNGSNSILSASFAISSSRAVTSSFAISSSNALTASFVLSSSYAVSSSNALTSSFLSSGTNAFIQNGNSFGTTALLGTNDNQSLALETSGSTRMFISSSGNIGIGTTTPTVALQIGDTTSGTGNYIKVLGNNSDSTYDVFVGARRYPRFTLEDTTVGGSAFQMWSLGNTMRFGTNTGTTETSAWYTKAGNAADVIFNGKVGIGAISPSFRLSVSASSNSDGIQVIQSGTSRIELKGDGTAVWGSAADFGRLTWDTGKAILQGQSGKALSLGANNSSDHLYINTSANVGIGTTSPGAKLDVNGNTIITGSLAVSQSLLQYSNITAVTSGSTSNVASFNTSSYTAAFFDYVTTSGTNARAGSVFTVWNGSSVEYTETSTNDIGSTSNLLLSASVSAGAVRLQATSLSGSWSVKTLARML